MHEAGDAIVPTFLSEWAAEAFGVELGRKGATTWPLLVIASLVDARGPWGEFLFAGALDDEDRKALLHVRSAHRRAADHRALEGEIEVLDEDFIEGWALDRSNPDLRLELQVTVDDAVVAIVMPDRFRRDLQDTYGGAGVYGFRTGLPFGTSSAPSRNARVEVREVLSQRRLAFRLLRRNDQARVDDLVRMGGLLEDVRAKLQAIEDHIPAARIATSFSVRSYDAYRRAFTVPAPATLHAHAAVAEGWSVRPRFVLAAYPPGASAGVVAQTTASLEAQTYNRWVWGADAGSRKRGDYIVQVRAGDELEPDALFHIAEAIGANASPRVVTVDDDELAPGEDGRRRLSAPRLRGAPDLWLDMQRVESGMLIAAEAELVREVDVEDLADAVSFFRLSSAAGRHRVRHVPRVLHHRFAPAAQPATAAEAFADEVRREVSSLGVAATVGPHSDALGARVEGALRIRPQGSQARLASVIIPTRDRIDLLRPCVEGLLASRGENATPFELIVVDNGGADPASAAYIDSLAGREGVRVAQDHAPFNWSTLNNRAVESAAGDVLVFLNDDTAPVSQAWCDELCLWATWPGAGVAGARCIYGDGTIQHAGIVTGAFGAVALEGVGSAGDDPGYLGRHALVRRASAVSGACMAVRRECFADLGGFDMDFAVGYNDVDFCLRANRKGWAVLYAPQAVFHHYESKTRRFERNLQGAALQQARLESSRLRAKWPAALLDDPFYNPHFERWAAPFTRLGAVSPWRSGGAVHPISTEDEL